MKFEANFVDWKQVEANKSFIRRLFLGEQITRPGVVYHPPYSLPEPPSHLQDFELDAWRFVEELRQRPIVAGDDRVPVMSTGAGTCAFATAFGCVETKKGGVFWPQPCIRDACEIDHLKMPKLTDGKMGGILEKTRTYRAILDERITIGIMDFQSPFTTVEQMLGSELFFLLPYDDPRRLHALMDIVTDYAIAFLQEQIRAIGENCCYGLWPIFYFPKEAGIQMADDNLCNVSSEVYEEFVIPYNDRISDAFGGLFLHSCIIRDGNLPTIAKLRNLTGLNCDISSGTSIEHLLNGFGHKMVIAPHCYINAGGQFRDYAHFMQAMLQHWVPPMRMFIYPCSVMYMPAESKEIPFDMEQVRLAMRPFSNRA